MFDLDSNQVESLDIKDFGILFSPKQKSGLLESSSAGMKKKSGSDSVDAASNKELFVDRKNEANPGTEPSGETSGPGGSKAR